MKLFYNKASGVVSTTAGGQANIQKITAKRYAVLDLEFIPTTNDGTVELFADGTAGVCVVKSKGDFAGSPQLLDSDWDAPVTEEAGYLFSFTVGGTTIDDLLGTDESIVLALEIVWSESGKREATPSLALEIYNSYWREDDPAPPDPATPFPLPGELLVKGEQELTDPEQAQVKTNLAINSAAFRITADGAEFYDVTLAQWVRLGFDNGQPKYTALT